MLQKVSNSLPTSCNILDFISITQKAAISAFTLRGRCDKEQGDAMAVHAMRRAFDSISSKGRVIVGEGEKDEAPMLYVGEEVGQGSHIEYDIVVDPLEGTRLLAEGKPNAISVLGILPHGILSFPKESYYMEKIVIPKCAEQDIDIEAPITDIISKVAHIIGKSLSEMEIFILDKPRHKELIHDILKLGARVQLHTDGDVAGALLALSPHSSIDMMLGIGGSPEGVLTALAIKASKKGQLFARFAPQLEQEKTALLDKGISLTTWFTADSIIPTDDVFFVATGVTSGNLLKGVEYKDGVYKTHSLAMSGKDGRSFYIEESSIAGNAQ